MKNLSNNKGSSIALILLISAIMGLGISQLSFVVLNQLSLLKHDTDIHSLKILETTWGGLLKSKAIKAAIINNNKDMNCLKSGKANCVKINKVIPLIVYDQYNVPMFSPKSVFKSTLSNMGICSTLGCKYLIKTVWKPLCSSTCIKPKIFVSYTISDNSGNHIKSTVIY